MLFRSLAVRKDNGQIILNGDEAPTVTSRRQQRYLRSALGTRARALLPFSALQAANIKPEDVQILSVTPDREIETWRKCKCDKAWHQKDDASSNQEEYIKFHDDGSHSMKVTQHFLGEVLFTREDHVGRLYVSGLDRKDRKSTRLNSSHSQQSRMPSSA